MTLLADLVATSQRIGASAARTAKVKELAALLTHLQPEEIALATLYMAGETRQGRIGIGYASLAGARGEAAQDPTLTIGQINRQLDALASARGQGSGIRRAQLLQELFGSATAAEQEFLLQLLVGELRQGALAGVMVEAIAAAAKLPAAAVRRAAMYASDLGSVAHAALAEGAVGLARFRLELFTPVAPMLAQTAT